MDNKTEKAFSVLAFDSIPRPSAPFALSTQRHNRQKNVALHSQAGEKLFMKNTIIYNNTIIIYIIYYIYK